MSIADKDLVVILHGIGMTPLRMAFVAACLKRAGYRILNLKYPSLRQDIEGCADFVAGKIAALTPPPQGKIHIVSHSMGCLVALHLMTRTAAPDIARAVFIAPPYRGSEVADFLQRFSVYKYLFGPAGAQLTTAYRGNITYALPTGTEIGVIAGTRAWEYPLFLSVMKKTGLHDGLVSVESTRIPGIKDFITIRMSHSFLLEKSVSQTLHFLTQGRFKAEQGMSVPERIDLS